MARKRRRGGGQKPGRAGGRAGLQKQADPQASGGERRLVGGIEPERELEAFSALRRCLLDSSSAIYMKKAGFLALLCSTLDISTIPQVVEETGYRDMPVTIVDGVGSEDANAGAPGPTTDELLVQTALARRLPVITEDRKMMLRLDAGGLPFFNALMMLHLLLFRGTLDPAAHSEHRSRLLEVCRYSLRVLEYGEEVYQAVLKHR
ncbi:hypothetical protein [Salinispira pacifica]